MKGIKRPSAGGLEICENCVDLWGSDFAFLHRIDAIINQFLHILHFTTNISNVQKPSQVHGSYAGPGG